MDVSQRLADYYRMLSIYKTHDHTQYVKWLFLPIMVASLAMFPGCKSTDSRISLHELVAKERVLSEMPPQSQPGESISDSNDPLGPYRVGSGDVLRVTVTSGDQREAAAAVQTRVDRRGEIELFLVSAIRVLDLELEDVEDSIRSAYVPNVYRSAVVHVELVSYDATNVLVIGAVIEPGLIALRRTERNMLYAIDGAGGVANIASGRVTLRRIGNPKDEATFDLTDPMQLQRALSIPPLQRGDILEVHAAQPNTVFVGGLVNRGSPQAYPPGTRVTILQALAAAGGLRTDVMPSEGTLIRRLPDGSEAHVKLDLDRLACGDDPNIMLAAGDILWVPETFETRLRDFINRNFFIRAGVSVNYNVTGIEFLNRASSQNARLGGSNLQDSFDPLGFLGRNTLLQGLSTSP